MTLQEQRAERQEQLGKAIKDAQDIAEKQRSDPDHYAEHEEAFKKAHSHATELKMELQRLDQEIDLEDWSSDLDRLETENAPVITDSPLESNGVFNTRLHHELFNTYLRTDVNGNAYQEMLRVDGAGPEEINLLLSSEDDLGGFTVPDDVRNEVLRAVMGDVVVRQAGARTMSTSKPGVTMPVLKRASANADQYTSTMNQLSNFKKEGAVTDGNAPTTQNNPQWGQERIPVHIWQPDAITFTRELLDDSDVNLEALVGELIGEVRSMDEDYHFLRGDGDGQPEGILSSGAAEIVWGDASTYATPASGDNGVSYDRVVNVFTGLAAQYRRNATWLFNSDTFGLILKVKDADSRPLFPINQLPGQLLTRPFLMTEFLDDGDTTAKKPVIFGDFRHYRIVERKQLTLQRLVERFAPNIGILPTARFGGQVTLPQAFRIGSVQA